MSTATTTDTDVAIEEATAPTQFTNINRAQLDLLKRTLAKGTTDDEFALFMNTATRLGIDPFARQIYAVKRWTKEEDSDKAVQVMAIQIGIDGFRAISEATADYNGQDGPFWCGEDGAWREVWTSKNPPAAAKVVVFRKGVERGFVGVASYLSFVQTKKNGDPVKMWASMPDVMLAKCAEAQALRKAFPRQLSGVHTDDEMGQAGDPAPAIEVTKLPPPVSAVHVQATAANPPAQQPPKPTVDTWQTFLADLAPLVAKVDGLAEHVIGNADVSTWVEKEVDAALAHLLDSCTTPGEVDAKAGPWGQIINKHARPGSRVAALYTGAKDAFIKRRSKLAAEAKPKNGNPETAGAPA